MPKLPSGPTLADFQSYVRRMESERGFSQKTVIEECLMLGEETGELFKAIRKSEHMDVDSQSKIGAPAEELADIFIYLCAIANRLDIDLETAFRDKEAINHGRTWGAQ